MRVGIVGSGRMAQAFGGYLLDKGYSLSGLWARDAQRGDEAALNLQAHRYPTLAELVNASEILFLAVSDDGIASVINGIKACGRPLGGKWVGHLSGSQSLDVLEPLHELNALCFSLHPLQTVPDPDSGRTALGNAVFSLEAEGELVKPLTQWLKRCGNQLVWLTPGRKSLYHLGACLASNYVTVLYHLAQSALVDAGVPADLAPEALYPLMSATLENYRHLGPLKGLTGPVSRGDTRTVRRHLDALESEPWRQRQDLIRLLALEALTMAREDGRLNADQLQRMVDILEGGISLE